MSSSFTDSDARRARHLRALELLQNGLAHDAKGPMNAIALNVELLRTTLGDKTGGASRWLDTIDREMRRLDAYLDLVLGQLDAPHGEVAATDLADLAGDVARLVEAPLRLRGARLETSLEPARARVDAHAVRQTLLWLVVDQIPDASSDAPLRLQTRVDGPHAEGARGEGARAVIEVSSPGAVPDAVGETDLARKIVEQHGGSLTVISSGTVTPCLRLDFPSIPP